MLQNIDIHSAGPHVDQSHHILVIHRIVEIEGVLYRKGIDVHDHRIKSTLTKDRDMVVDKILFGRDKQHIHDRRIILVGADDMKIEKNLSYNFV